MVLLPGVREVGTDVGMEAGRGGPLRFCNGDCEVLRADEESLVAACNG
jgi:hypothetical protein